METSNNSTSLENLDSGDVECTICHKGHLKPFNPQYKVNHSFICDNCGANLHITPNVIVE